MGQSTTNFKKHTKTIHNRRDICNLERLKYNKMVNDLPVATMGL